MSYVCSYMYVCTCIISIYNQKCMCIRMCVCVWIYVRTDQRVKRENKQLKGRYISFGFLGCLGGSVS